MDMAVFINPPIAILVEWLAAPKAFRGGHPQRLWGIFGHLFDTDMRGKGHLMIVWKTCPMSVCT